MTHENFKKVINQIVKLKDHRLALHGFGDVFLNPDFFDNLAYLDEKDFRRVDFSTNGLLLTENRIKKLLKFKCLKWVMISLNSCRKEAHEKINTDSNFEQVVESIKYFISLSSPIEVRIQMMKNNLTKDETEDEFRRLLGDGSYGLLSKTLHSYSGQLKDGLSNLKQIDCFKHGEYQFAPLPMMHWDGDLLGCCCDDTKTQIYGNAFTDGIFSEKVQKKRQELAIQLQNQDFSDLPLCRQCVKD